MRCSLTGGRQQNHQKNRWPYLFMVQVFNASDTASHLRIHTQKGHDDGSSGCVLATLDLESSHGNAFKK